jgi:hypothetical protein
MSDRTKEHPECRQETRGFVRLGDDQPRGASGGPRRFEAASRTARAQVFSRFSQRGKPREEERVLNKRPILRYRLVVGFAASTLVASISPNARAEGPAAHAAVAGPGTDLAAAKSHYSEGEKKYKAGDFEGALVAFKMANDVKATPQAERYIGLCEDALGHYPVAVDWYDTFLAHVPDKMAAAAEELKKRVVDIKAMPGKVHVESTPPGAGVMVDDKPAAGPTPVDIDLPPGSHKVTLTAPGRISVEKQVDVTFAAAETVTATLDAVPPPPAPVAAPVVVASAPPPPAPPPPAPGSPVPAYITGGIAVAAVAVGTVFGIIALNDKSDFDNQPTTQKADDGDTHSLIADMAFGIGLTFGVTSAVLFLTKDDAAASSASSTGQIRTANRSTPNRKDLPLFVPTPLVGPHFGGGGLLVRF